MMRRFSTFLLPAFMTVYSFIGLTDAHAGVRNLFHPPGSAYFQPAAMDGNIRPDDEAFFKFGHLPPVLRSWRAYVGYFILIVSGIFVVDRIQRARVIRQEQQKARLGEAEIVSQKNLELLERNKQIV